MAEIYSFTNKGWADIWKNKIIFSFSALSLVNLVLFFRQSPIEANPLDLAFSFATILISFITTITSLIGVPYLAFCFSVGRKATFQETLSAVRKFFWRIVGCGCFGFILFLPMIFFIIAFSIDSRTEMFELPSRIFLLSLPLSALSALWDFSLFGFFSKDWSIPASLKNAWLLFKSHFSVLATLGIGIVLINGVYSAVSGITTLLVQSGFDMASLSQLNFINPTSTLGSNLLFITISRIGNIVFAPFYASVFATAFVKYSRGRI